MHAPEVFNARPGGFQCTPRGLDLLLRRPVDAGRWNLDVPWDPIGPEQCHLRVSDSFRQFPTVSDRFPTTEVSVESLFETPVRYFRHISDGFRHSKSPATSWDPMVPHHDAPTDMEVWLGPRVRRVDAPPKHRRPEMCLDPLGYIYLFIVLFIDFFIDGSMGIIYRFIYRYIYRIIFLWIGLFIVLIIDLSIDLSVEINIDLFIHRFIYRSVYYFFVDVFIVLSFDIFYRSVHLSINLFILY